MQLEFNRLLQELVSTRQEDITQQMTVMMCAEQHNLRLLAVPASHEYTSGSLEVAFQTVMWCSYASSNNHDRVHPVTSQAAAFKRLYPDKYFARFVADGLRPDGRTLGRARATTIGLNAVSTADASALVKARGP